LVVQGRTVGRWFHSRDQVADVLQCTQGDHVSDDVDSIHPGSGLQMVLDEVRLEEGRQGVRQSVKEIHEKTKGRKIMYDSEYDEVKAILANNDVTDIDQIEYGSEVYEDLFGYYMDSGEMPYGIMKARDGMPDEWIIDRLIDMGFDKEVVDA